MFKVVHKGGMIGASKRQPKIFPTKEEAKEYAKKQRSYLSTTDRKYYKESFTVHPATKLDLSVING
jgi:hypothetical protein